MELIKKQFLAKGYSERSTRNYVKWVIELQEYCMKQDPSKITFQEIEDFVYHYLPKRRNLSSQSINNAISSYKVYFNKILGIDYKISELKRPKRVSESAEFFEKDELLLLINYFQNLKHKLIVTLLYTCALDISSAILIRKQDMDLKRRRIKIRNTKDIPIRESVIGDFELTLIEKYLKEYKPSVYLFENYKVGVKYSTRSIQTLVKKAVTELKMTKLVTSRSFKYSYVQHFSELGYPLKNILEQIGFIKNPNYSLYAEITYNSKLEIKQSPLDIIANYTHNDKTEEIRLKNEISLKEISFIYDSPYLEKEDVDSAIEMSKLYTILHCYENSTRKFIDKILTKEIGLNWWDKVATPDMKNRVDQKRNKEKSQKWLSSRGSENNPLFYVDWSDLLKIFRKKEELFTPYINDIKFVELRLEELERTRHIIAHNGILPGHDDYQRLELYYKDWIKQLK